MARKLKDGYELVKVDDKHGTTTTFRGRHLVQMSFSVHDIRSGRMLDHQADMYLRKGSNDLAMVVCIGDTIVVRCGPTFNSVIGTFDEEIDKQAHEEEMAPFILTMEASVNAMQAEVAGKIAEAENKKETEEEAPSAK